MSADARIALIGAGPTGLGAATRLHELGHPEWHVYEAARGTGGLSRSMLDEQGFTWDLGGHVLFSHYRYFDRLMDDALGDAWLTHIREAWVWMRERWVPYPFQNNIWRLPQGELDACLDGLREVERMRGSFATPESFEDWLLQGFGRGLCDVFMLPYNFKVWGYAPSKLDVGWMGERVARVDLERVLENVEKQVDDVGWGPNATFRFPLRGGTGAIWKAVYDRLPPDRFSLGSRVGTVDLESHRLHLTSGESVEYDALISSMPLDKLLASIPDRPDLQTLSREFVRSASHIIGVGLEGQPPEHLETKCWMYFPEDHTPFYRVTVFSNYSPNNVARPGEQWSLMAEVSETSDKPVDATRVVEAVVSGLRACGLISDTDEIVSRWHRRLDYGYPTPWLGRDEVLEQAESVLRAHDVFSRGRFGAWKYEVSNQDHSVAQGVEAVNHILTGSDERTYYGDMSD